MTEANWAPTKIQMKRRATIATDMAGISKMIVIVIR